MGCPASKPDLWGGAVNPMREADLTSYSLATQPRNSFYFPDTPRPAGLSWRKKGLLEPSVGTTLHHSPM